jgi:endonuclease/exonuclease/phosphatase (EEP) superfamily protein YafD
MIEFGLQVFIAAYIIGLVAYLGFRIFLGDNYWWLGLLNEFALILFLPLPVSFALSVLLKNQWGIAGNLLLITIALVWFGPYYLPKNPSPATSPTLKIVTFNIWGDNARLAQVDAWLQEVQPDLVLLQEIPFTLADNEALEVNRLYPYQAGQSTAVHPYGNLFLSRYPILLEEALPGEGVPAQQRFTIDVNGRIIAVYNVHLAQPIGESRLPNLPESFVTHSILNYNNSTRNQEIRQLLKWVKQESGSVIVAGDFNMSDHAAIYGELSDLLVDSFREAGTGLGKSWPVRIVNEIPPYIPLLLRVDYIWHSQDLRTVTAHRGPQLGSDHLPFYAELELLG